MDDDDELGYVTDIFHNALQSDPKYRVLDACQKAGLDFTMPIHMGGSISCLRDECLGVSYGVGIIRKLMDMGVDMNAGVIKGRTPINILMSKNVASGLCKIKEDYPVFHFGNSFLVNHTFG